MSKTCRETSNACTHASTAVGTGLSQKMLRSEMRERLHLPVGEQHQWLCQVLKPAWQVFMIGLARSQSQSMRCPARVSICRGV
jgi:hypothetical protein